VSTKIRSTPSQRAVSTSFSSRREPRLGEVLPDHVERSAADHRLVLDGHPELLHVLVEGDGRLPEQDPLLGVPLDEPADRRDVRRSCAPDLGAHSGAQSIEWNASRQRAQGPWPAS
jgi:hypothetical protein